MNKCPVCYGCLNTVTLLEHGVWYCDFCRKYFYGGKEIFPLDKSFIVCYNNKQVEVKQFLFNNSIIELDLWLEDTFPTEEFSTKPLTNEEKCDILINTKQELLFRILDMM